MENFFYQEMAIAVLEKRDVSSVRSFCQFLSSIPVSKQRRQILLAAILHYAESEDREKPDIEEDSRPTNSDSVFLWALQNRSLFKPDLDLMLWTKQKAQRILSAAGCEAGRGAGWNGDQLRVSEVCYSWLRQCCEPGELKLMQVLLDIEIQREEL